MLRLVPLSMVTFTLSNSLPKVCPLQIRLFITPKYGQAITNPIIRPHPPRLEKYSAKKNPRTKPISSRSRKSIHIARSRLQNPAIFLFSTTGKELSSPTVILSPYVPSIILFNFFDLVLRLLMADFGHLCNYEFLGRVLRPNSCIGVLRKHSESGFYTAQQFMLNQAWLAFLKDCFWI